MVTKMSIERQKRGQVVYAETVDDIDRTEVVRGSGNTDHLAVQDGALPLECAGSEAEWVLGSGRVCLRYILPFSEKLDG